MSNTINQSGYTVEISDIDSDWTWTDTFTDSKYANGIRINYIQFNPAAANDACSIKEGADTGPQFFRCSAEDANAQKAVNYYGAIKKPVLDFSAGIFTAGSSVIIELWPDSVKSTGEHPRP